MPTPDDPVRAWAEAVAKGGIVAGPHVRNAARRHLRDLDEGPRRGLKWDLPAAQRAIGFCKDVLRLNGGQFEGSPFVLHPSQQFIVGSLFGWKKTAGNVRRFRRGYIEQGKGSGKSPMAAAIGIYMLVADGEARSEVYAAASKKDQAFVLFRDAVAMYQQSEKLQRRIVTSGANPVWNLAHLESGSFFRPISSDDGQSGPRPHCALVDEVHEMRGPNMIEMLERGFKWRRQPLLLMTTNAGSSRTSVCWQEHQHAVRVAAMTLTPDAEGTFVGDTVVDDETFSFVCALDKNDDPFSDPGCWTKANPTLGTTITEDYLAGVVRQAAAIPGRMNNILRLHFCSWTEADEGWLSRPTLEAVVHDFDPAIHYGARMFVGADLSATRDMTAIACMVPTGMVEVEREDGIGLQPTFDMWTEQWTPAATLTERSKTDDAPYEAWCQQGWLVATPGPLVRMDIVAARLAELASQYDLQAIAYDATAFQRHFTTEIDAAGLETELVEHPQGGKRKASQSGLWMPGSVRALEELILERRVRIRANDATIAAFMAATFESDAFDNRWFSKRHAYQRIDALVAAGMATGLAIERGEKDIDVRAMIG